MPLFERSITQIALAGGLSVILGGLIGYSGSGGSSSSGSVGEPVSATAATRSEASGGPTCASLRLRRDDDRELTCRTRRATLTFVNGPGELRVPGFRGRVRAVEAYKAATREGRARRRVRVVVRFAAEAVGPRAALTEEPPLYLVVGDRRVAPDGSFTGSDAFLVGNGIEPGASRQGELRFELGGATTDRFLAEGGQLGVRPFAGDGIGVIRLRPPKAMRPLPGG